MLPKDIVIVISWYLSRKQIIRFSAVNKYIYQILRPRLQKINAYCNARAKCLIVHDVYNLFDDANNLILENVPAATKITYKYPKPEKIYTITPMKYELCISLNLDKLIILFNLNIGDIIYLHIYSFKYAIVITDNYALKYYTDVRDNLIKYARLVSPGYWKNFHLFANKSRYEPSIQCWVVY